MTIKIKRIYEPADKRDGWRVLVDRLWPRGVSKARAKVDVWLKNVAPSSALRTWYGHDPKKWLVFQTKYKAELRANKDVRPLFREIQSAHRRVTLLYASRDSRYTHALVLQRYLHRYFG